MNLNQWIKRDKLTSQNRKTTKFFGEKKSKTKNSLIFQLYSREKYAPKILSPKIKKQEQTIRREKKTYRHTTLIKLNIWQLKKQNKKQSWDSYELSKTEERERESKEEEEPDHQSWWDRHQRWDGNLGEDPPWVVCWVGWWVVE